MRTICWCLPPSSSSADGLETSRASTVSGGTAFTRTVNTRDDAKRLTKATLTTGSGSLDSNYLFDQKGHLTHQWGSGFASVGADGLGDPGAQGTQAYTYSTESGLKTAEDLRLLAVGGTVNAPETTTTEAPTTTTEGATTTTEGGTTTTGVPTTTTEAPATTTTEAAPVTSFVGRLVSAYTYTDSGRLATASIDINGGDSSDAFTETYTFDAAGNLTSDGTRTYVYDQNRLAQTKIGTEVQTYFFFDSGKRWRTVQAPTSSETDPNRTTYAYTGTGRLSEFKKYSSGSVAVQGSYQYDSVGQRTRSVVSKDGTETTTDFTYTGLTLHKLEAEEKQGDTTLAKWTITYLYDEYGKPYAGIYRDTTDPQNPAAPVTFALVTTDRGDVVELLDANGSPFAAYRYDAWGNPIGNGNVGTGLWAQATTQGETETISLDVATKIAQRQVLRYAGYCYDSESGMYYLSARHYDPATRQFLSKDLSRNDGEQSAYGYCLGNPVKNIDPSGYAFMDIFKNMKKAMAKWTAKAKATSEYSKQKRRKVKSKPTTQAQAQGTQTDGIESTYELLFKWIGAKLPETIQYGASDWQLREMKSSPVAEKMRDAFAGNGYEDVNGVALGIGEAFVKTAAPKLAIGSLFGPIGVYVGGLVGFSDTPAQVGGVDGAWVHKTENGLFATYHVENYLTLDSFLYHIPGFLGIENRDHGEYMGTVRQVFEWTEPLPVPFPDVVQGLS